MRFVWCIDMIKEILYSLLEKIGYKNASDKRSVEEEQTFLDFGLTLEVEDGIIVSKVTTEPEKYSGFVYN